MSTAAVRSLRTPARSLRDARADETRARLFHAAIALVHEQGWKKTTAAQIAERAGVAKGTFFVHFPTKESLVFALVEKQTSAAASARDDLLRANRSPIERLRATVLKLGELAALNLPLSRAVLVATLESDEVGAAADARFTELYQAMIRDAREAVREGLVEGVDGETLAGLLMASYLGATLHCTSSPHAKPLEQVLAPLVDATLRSVAAKRAATKTTKTAKGTRRR